MPQDPIIGQSLDQLKAKGFSIGDFNPIGMNIKDIPGAVDVKPALPSLAAQQARASQEAARSVPPTWSQQLRDLAGTALEGVGDFAVGAGKGLESTIHEGGQLLRSAFPSLN